MKDSNLNRFVELQLYQHSPSMKIKSTSTLPICLSIVYGLYEHTSDVGLFFV